MSKLSRIFIIVGLVIFIALLAFALNSRVSNQELSPTITVDPNISTSIRAKQPLVEFKEWARNWLYGTSCQAPCWEGIVPGKTTVREALSQLRKISMIQPESVQIVHMLCGDHEGDEIADSRQIVWQWAVESHTTVEGIAQYESPYNVGRTCNLDFMVREFITPDLVTMDSIVIRIKLDFQISARGLDSEGVSVYGPFTLGDIITAYGEPSNIVAVKDPEFSWYSLNVIYESQGFVLMKDSRSEFALNENIDFQEIVFSTTPISDGLEYFPDDALIPWQGMKSFDFYCRLKDNGNPCQ